MLLFVFILIGVWIAVGTFAVRAVRRGRDRRNDALRDKFTNKGENVYIGHIQRSDGPSGHINDMPPPRNDAMENGNVSSLLAMWLQQFNR